MFTPTRLQSPVKPETFESLNNGVWYYNYDVIEEVVEVKEDNSNDYREEPRYNYILVRINGTPTLQKCLEAILKQYVDENNTTLYDILTLEGINTQIEDIYHSIKVDFNLEPEMTRLDKAKEEILRKIDEWDASSNVNSFSLNGVQVWLSKDTRVGLMNSLTIEKNAGKEESILWFNNISLTLNCDAAIKMLSDLELYALACYNQTSKHKVVVESLTDINEVLNYDYKSGYPEKLVLTT